MRSETSQEQLLDRSRKRVGKILGIYDGAWSALRLLDQNNLIIPRHRTPKTVSLAEDVQNVSEGHEYLY